MWDVKEPTHYSKRVGREVSRCCGCPLCCSFRVLHIGITSCTFPPWTEMSKKNRYDMILFYVCFNLLWIPMQIGISSVGDEKQLRNWKRHFGATWIIRASLYTMWASGWGNGLLWINLIASLLLFSCNFAISSCSSSHRACGQNKVTLKKKKGKKMKGVEFSVYQLYINCTIS